MERKLLGYQVRTWVQTLCTLAVLMAAYLVGYRVIYGVWPPWS